MYHGERDSVTLLSDEQLHSKPTPWLENKIVETSSARNFFDVLTASSLAIVAASAKLPEVLQVKSPVANGVVRTLSAVGIVVGTAGAGLGLLVSAESRLDISRIKSELKRRG